MGGITTGIGLFSGIDTASLIDQLIASQSRPKILAQQRIFQLSTQQAAFLDINSRLNAFKTAAASFRVNDVFSTRTVTSSDETVLGATASSAAVPGSYNFIVDRLVSTQQILSRGFPTLDSSAVGIPSLTFESPAARLDANTALADLNNGDGITRGVITVNGTEVDLSTAGTVQEVLDAISVVPGVSARVENDHFVITGVDTLSETTGAGIISSLGLESYDGDDDATLSGSSVFSMSVNTTLQSLNDGRGVSIRTTFGEGVFDFTIAIDTNGDGVIDGDDDDPVGVRIGDIDGPLLDDEDEPILDDEDVATVGTIEGAVSSVGGVIDRINDALNEAGYSDVTASVNTTTGAIDIVDSMGRNFNIENKSSNTSTADDLGISGSYTGGTASGSRILAGLNTKLVSSLNGGTGLQGTDGELTFTTQDGLGHPSINVGGLDDINDIINKINTQMNGAVTASVNSNGTGIQIVDNTTSIGGGGLIISGSSGADTAEALGISGTFADGATTGSNLQLAYLGRASLVSELNNGQGIGTGKFEIIDTYGTIVQVNITSNDKTLGDIINRINGAGNAKIKARINDHGDGIIIEEDAFNGDGDPVPSGLGSLKISNLTGTVASKLGIAGTASETGADSFLDGSFEKVIEFDGDATLKDIRNAINSADIGVSASIVNTGIGTSPFRLNLTSDRTGLDGRFLIDSGEFDMGFDVLDKGDDARVFFGSTDPASAVLMTSSTNQLDGVIQGVTIDLLSSSEDPVSIAVATDVSGIESKVSDFVAAFNAVIEGIDFRTRFDEETNARGVLLGDGTVLNLRNSLYATINRSNDGFTGTVNTLNEVGITIGSGGKLEFDSSKFRDAYAEDPQSVENLFTRQTLDADDDDDANTIDEPFFSELSVLGQLEEFAESYVTSIGGVLQTKADSLDAQIKLQEERIESIQKSLDNKRLILGRQFLAMEQAIGAFQTQGASLSQLASLG